MSVEQNWAQKFCKSPSQYVLKCENNKMIPEEKWGFLGCRAIKRLFERYILKSNAYDLENVLGTIASTYSDTVTKLTNEEKGSLRQILRTWKDKRISHVSPQKQDTLVEQFVHFEKLCNWDLIKQAIDLSKLLPSQLTFLNTSKFPNGPLHEHCRQAVSLYEQAAAAGDPLAMSLLSQMYELGAGVEQDLEKAKKLAYASLDTEDLPELTATINWVGGNSSDISLNHKEIAAEVIKNISSKELVEKEVSSFFKEALSLKKTNPKRALILFEKASYLGDPSAMLNLAIMYSEGVPSRSNLAKAKDWAFKIIFYNKQWNIKTEELEALKSKADALYETVCERLGKLPESTEH